MSKHHFLLTYSVVNRNDSNSADQVRRQIAELEQWEKLDTVETTFVGKLDLVGYNIRAKRDEAESDIKSTIRAIVDDLDVHYDVDVNIALLVDGLGEHIEIYI